MKIKKTAALQLRHHYVSAAAIILIALSTELFIRAFEFSAFFVFYPENKSIIKWFIIVGIALLIEALLTWPLKIGKTYCFLKLHHKSKINALDAFHFFSSFKLYISSITLIFIKRLYLIIVSAISIIPGLIVIDIFSKSSRLFSYEQLSAMPMQIGQFGGILIILIGIVFIIKSMLSIFLIDYIYIAHTKNPFKALFCSLKLMRRNRISLLSLLFSFTGWFLLCLSVFPILYVLPLLNQSTAIFASRILKSHNIEKSLKSNNYVSICTSNN